MTDDVLTQIMKLFECLIAPLVSCVSLLVRMRGKRPSIFLKFCYKNIVLIIVIYLCIAM